MNPHKRDKYVSGSGHRILGPEQAAREAPELVVVMNPVYSDEIRTELARLGLDAEVRAA